MDRDARVYISTAIHSHSIDNLASQLDRTRRLCHPLDKIDLSIIMSKKDAVSASSMGTRVITAAGCHVLRIKGYSQTKLLGTGAAALSCRFEAAGQIWRISYYPNGRALSPDSI
jgi:hypothetical protein